MKFVIALAVLAVALPAVMSTPQIFASSPLIRSSILDHSLYSPFYRSAAFYPHHYSMLARTVPAVVAAEPITKSTVVAGPSGTIAKHEGLTSSVTYGW